MGPIVNLLSLQIVKTPRSYVSVLFCGCTANKPGSSDYAYLPAGSSKSCTYACLVFTPTHFVSRAPFAGCLGLAFFNATAGSRVVLRHMLQHAQRNMHVMFDDQQALNHQLLRVSTV
jgi:hypothetical protein